MYVMEVGPSTILSQKDASRSILLMAPRYLRGAH